MIELLVTFSHTLLMIALVSPLSRAFAIQHIYEVIGNCGDTCECTRTQVQLQRVIMNHMALFHCVVLLGTARLGLVCVSTRV